MNRRPTLLFFLIFLLPDIFPAQNLFEISKLDQPETFGAEIGSKLKTIEVSEYHEKDQQRIFLKNGFRASQFQNEKDWLKIKDSVTPYRVDIVYSKYPLTNGVWEEIYPLLFSRIKASIQLDSRLNKPNIEWNKIWQTHCENNEQVSQLFHGVVIWYKSKSKSAANTASVNPVNSTTTTANTNTLSAETQSPTFTEFKEPQQDLLVSEQNSMDDLLETVDNIKSSSFFPDSLRIQLSKLSLDMQIKKIRQYLETSIKKTPETKLSAASADELKRYNSEIDAFMERYPATDMVVLEVFNRHPEWKNILVINDWTGSMYGYGAQVLEWHVKNFQKSGITSITLFNDGDLKHNNQKKIGQTGGIYIEKADNVDRMIQLFNLVMINGTGGDGPENDIESILKAIETNTFFSEIVLIADNNACVRDIELADRISKPVKVIICGYDKSRGVNPDFVYLAKKTGGGVYTIEDDLENINAVVGEKGEVTAFTDERFKIWGKRCGYGSQIIDYELYNDYKKALHHKNEVRKLSLSHKQMEKIPKGVFKMHLLNYLNLSNNGISEVPEKIGELTYLKFLDLSFNHISKIPEQLSQIFYLGALNLCGNPFDHFPQPVMGLRYLTDLDISHCRLSKIDGKFNCRKLEYMNLSYNMLSEIPSSFSTLKKLKVLKCSDNQLKSIPNEIIQLNKLEELDLENNHLTTLPEQLYKLRRLKILRLSGNEFDYREQQRIKKELPRTNVQF